MSLHNFILINEKSSKLENKADLIFQEFLDNMNSGYYSKNENKITFNVGKITKLSRHSDLELTIRENNTEQTRLAKLKDKDSYVIVIDVNTLPKTISKIKEILENSKNYKDITSAIVKYINLSKNSNVNKLSSMTDYEKEKYYNNEDAFEKTFQSLIERIKEKIEEYKKIEKNFKEQIEKTGSAHRRSTLELALEKLKEEYLGKNLKEFKKKVSEILDDIDPNFRQHLDKQSKKILDSRLKQFFEEIN